MNSENSNFIILFVEDEEEIRNNLSKFLKRFTDKLFIAIDGEEGLEFYKKYKPNIVISDIQMPKMNGVEMVKAIKKINDNQAIIFTTAHIESSFFIEAIELQADGYILKPIDLELLAKNIKKVKQQILLKQENEENIKTQLKLSKSLKLFDKYMIASSTDINGCITSATESFCEISGYSLEELIGKNHNIIQNSETSKELYKNLWATIQSGNVWNNKIKNRKKNGETYWISSTIMPDYDENNTLIGYISTEHEIINPKEQELNKQINDIFNSCNITLFRWNNNEKRSIDYVSDNVQEILGYSKREFMLEEVSYLSLIHKKDLVVFKKEIKEAYNGKVKSFTHKLYRVKSKNGEYIWVNDVSQIVKDTDGSIKFYVGYIQDITQSRQNEINIILEKERFQLAIDGSNDGLWDWNPQTNEVYFSLKWKEMLGYADNEIKSELDEWVSRVHPDDIEKAFADVQAHIDGKTAVYENVQRMKHKDGHWVWILDRSYSFQILITSILLILLSSFISLIFVITSIDFKIILIYFSLIPISNKFFLFKLMYDINNLHSKRDLV